VSPGIRLVIRATLLEALRRKDAWVLGILMGAYALVALGARLGGGTDASAATFMLNLGLSLSVLFAHLLTVLLAGRQFPDEIENRTLYPLLARPVTRRSLLLGKWIAGGLVGLVTLAAFALLAWGVAPRAQAMSPLTGMQFFAALPFSLFWASALAILLSLWLPRASALSAGLVLVMLGERLATWTRDVPVLAHLLPRFGALNLATRLTDGAPPLAGGEFLVLILYATVWTLLCVELSIHLFQRRGL
jgi:ABC-type transport system involved in multi-copper enzyme maturation permease subunit